MDSAHLPKILLVDDQEENLIALTAILKTVNAVVVPARSGEDALRALMADDFAVILLDVVMPDMDGFETAYHIKRKDRTKDVPIIFLTAARSEPDLAFRGYAVGAVDYLVKPFDPWVLRSKVEIFIELHEQRRRARERSAILTGLFPGASTGLAHGAGLVSTLNEHMAAVHKAMSALADRIDDVEAKEAFDRLDEEVAGLRSAHDALFGCEI
ncbi:response regulator [Actinomadura barringtoniae]|uniref:Response regulator n=1 Tax=Actinomadura barringtoniae TaxID=1427535 RepID=A0A939PNH7_9ACTN|nr:response regulator [Actinomadura barringtoniae]MBO2455480.1 response regulator [Actinomadura barringtoniae]